MQFGALQRLPINEPIDKLVQIESIDSEHPVRIS